ncbi:MAG: site-specific DNA-methyltransferase, partial [Tissierellia bacterium]|nr:site-specific DNA-methyltransferase [Tissierellia bacterium]
NYWENSYTKYSNEIGLTSEGKYLNYNTDVVLDFPHKDSVLEGGMTKEEQGKKEIYYHNVLAKEEIDTLLSPKILTSIKKYDRNGAYDITQFNDTDNLIIRGNNLIALYSLKERFENKVKLIYIDIPFNTGNDSFKYNDKFNHSTWLTFMKNRLEVAKKLLRRDGVIFVHCDDNEHGYLKVLSDEVFGRSNFVNSISILSSTPSGLKTAHRDKTIIKTKDHILVYKMDELEVKPQYTETKKWDSHFNLYLDREKNIVKSLKDVLHEESIYTKETPINQYSLNDGKFVDFVYKNSDNIFQTGKSMPEDIREKSLKKENRDLPIKYNSGENIQYAYNGRRMSFLSNSMNEVLVKNSKEKRISKLVCDFWDDIDFNNSQNEGGVSFPAGKKPEKLLYRIIDMVTEENDIVLDFFLGSATTAAVAHKMNRQYIGVEQMDYVDKIALKRMKSILDGEKSGISNAVNWDGGGSFVYAELASLNERYVKDIQQASNEAELEKVLSTMKESAYLNFKVDLERVSSKDEGYHALSLEERKEVLIQVLDMNQLYLSYSEIEDEQYKIPQDVKAFNHSFYDKEGVKDE